MNPDEYFGLIKGKDMTDDFNEYVKELTKKYHYGEIGEEEYKMNKYEDLKMTEKIAVNAMAAVEMDDRTKKKWVLTRGDDKVIFCLLNDGEEFIRYQLFTETSSIEERRGMVVSPQEGRDRWVEFVKDGYQ